MPVPLLNAESQGLPGLEQPGFQGAAHPENQVKHPSKNHEKQEKPQHRVHDEAVQLFQATQPGMPHQAAILKNFQGQVMALGGQDLVGRSLSQGRNFLADSIQVPLEIRIVFQEKLVYGQRLGLDGPDGGKAGIGYHRKIGREHFGQFLYPVFHFPRVAQMAGPSLPGQNPFHPVHEVLGSLAAGGHRPDDRHPESFLQGLRVNFHPLFLGQVHHVQDHHHRVFQLQQLHGQFQAAAKKRGIDDIDNEVRFFLEDVGQDHFFLRFLRGQGIGSRQVDYGIDPAFPGHFAVGMTDRGTREVRRLCFKTGNGVE